MSGDFVSTVRCDHCNYWNIPDDFADAVNYAAMYLWGIYRRQYPKITFSSSNIKELTSELLAELDGVMRESAEPVFEVE
jgi:hypothetical protein